MPAHDCLLSRLPAHGARAYGIARYVERIPAEILLARNRAEVVKKLDGLLADGPEPRAVASRPDPRVRPIVR